jgi:hypothetical protein
VSDDEQDPAAPVLERAAEQLIALAVAFDEPVDAQTYPLALLSLGHRSRTLFQAFLELQAGAVPIAARTLVRPMVELNILVRFLRKDPDLHTELWQAESERDTITMLNEIEGSTHLSSQLPEGLLDGTELEARKCRVSEARERGVKAGLPIKRGSVLPSVSAQLKVIAEPAAETAYTFAYRSLSWDVHGSPRVFLSGTWMEHNDGTFSYTERPSAKDLLPAKALAIGTFASTVELVAVELGLAAACEAREIRATIMEIPPGTTTT